MNKNVANGVIQISKFLSITSRAQLNILNLFSRRKKGIEVLATYGNYIYGQAEFNVKKFSEEIFL